jgi:Uma2 family endonuclease
MNMPIASPLLTTAELLAIPEKEGTTLYLIRGQLREVSTMTKRNRFHSGLMAWISFILHEWLATQPQPRGDVFAGEAGCILRRNPDSTVGIDVAYVSADVLTSQTDETTMIEGVPILVVEILSPSTTVEEINEKTDEYLAAGVPLTWIVNPHLRTVLVLRPGQEPEGFNMTHELSGEPHLPCFRVPVSRIFRR